MNLTQESFCPSGETQQRIMILNTFYQETQRPQSEPCPWTAPPFEIIEEEVESLFCKLNVPEESGASLNQTFEIKKMSKCMVIYLDAKSITFPLVQMEQVFPTVSFSLQGRWKPFLRRLCVPWQRTQWDSSCSRCYSGWRHSHQIDRITVSRSGALSNIKDLISHVLTSLEVDTSSWSPEPCDSPATPHRLNLWLIWS